MLYLGLIITAGILYLTAVLYKDDYNDFFKF